MTAAAAQRDNLPVAFRPMEQGDRAFVIDTWLQSYKNSTWARGLPAEVYWSRFGHSGLVEHLVQPAGAVVIACLPERPEFIYGWGCATADDRYQPLLHYVYVKQDFRRFGIGRRLIPEMPGPLRVTHLTKAFREYLAKGRPIEFVNPYRRKA